MSALPSAGAHVGALEGVRSTRLRTLVWTPDEPDVAGRVVMVHGLGEHGGRHVELAHDLTGRGFAVMAYDQRGHGGSGGRRGVGSRFEDFLDDLDTVLGAARSELPGRGGPILFGHSLGGLVALRYLQTRRPTPAAAVLSAPWLETSAPIPFWKKAARVVLRRIAPDLTLDAGVDASVLTRDPVKQREYEDDPLVHSRISAGLFEAVVEAQARALAEPFPDDLPLLVLVPLADEVADAGTTRRWAERLDGPVTVELLEGFRHEPLNDLGRATVRESVVAWIQRHATVEPESNARVRE